MPASASFDIFPCMSKYEPLWKYIKTKGASLIGIPIDHSFLTYKKELLEFGYKVSKISMKEKFVMFEVLL